MTEIKVSPHFIVRQQVARRNLLHHRLMAAERARQETIEDLERYRDETKALYAARDRPREEDGRER